MKLQDAYASETSSLGTWKVIGYAKPGGSNFDYAENTSTLTVTCATGTLNSETGKCVAKNDKDEDIPGTVASSTYTEAWSASNIADLNDCKKGKNWVIAATIGENTTSTVTAGTVSYNSQITQDACTALTPNFTAIGK